MVGKSFPPFVHLRDSIKQKEIHTLFCTCLLPGNPPPSHLSMQTLQTSQTLAVHLIFMSLLSKILGPSFANSRQVGNTYIS